jgi:hypothetical protein
MDFLFYIPFFCTAAGAAAEIYTVWYAYIEFHECQKADFEPS